MSRAFLWAIVMHPDGAQFLDGDTETYLKVGAHNFVYKHCAGRGWVRHPDKSIDAAWCKTKEKQARSLITTRKEMEAAGRPGSLITLSKFIPLCQ